VGVKRRGCVAAGGPQRDEAQAFLERRKPKFPASSRREFTALVQTSKARLVERDLLDLDDDPHDDERHADARPLDGDAGLHVEEVVDLWDVGEEALFWGGWSVGVGVFEPWVGWEVMGT
jgi:hypothetical protein